MPKSVLQTICAACLLAMVAISGCAPATDDVEITGTVTWNGAPLPQASIILAPVDPHIAPTGGKVVDGQFKLRGKPGKFRIEIEAIRETGKRDPVDNGLLGEMYIPPRYNRESELTAEVTRDGSNKFDFALKE